MRGERGGYNKKEEVDYGAGVNGEGGEGWKGMGEDGMKDCQVRSG